MKRFLLCPAEAKGQGTGHLVRCVDLAPKLRAETRILTGWNSQGNPLIDIPPEKALPFEKLSSCGEWDFILLDRRATSLAEMQELRPFGCIIGLDEGGSSRRYVPYLIDTLPTANGQSRANVSSVSFLDLPGENSRKKETFEFPFKKILITFGGEDPTGLTLSLLGALARSGLLRDSSFSKEVSLTVALGPAFREDVKELVRRICAGGSKTADPLKGGLPEIEVLPGPKNLKETLYQYDLVLTSFGFTCFESLSAGVPVILLNPTGYHQRLSRDAGIPEIGVRRPSAKRLRTLLREKERFLRLPKSMEAHLVSMDSSLDGWLRRLHKPQATWACPGCGNELNPVVARFPRRSYLRCGNCDLIYLLSFSGRESSYEEEYFNEEYRRQYGRTYLEDFDNIKAASHQRLNQIQRLAPRLEKKTLLDVGCAFGPFLKAASEQGLSPCGIDLSASSVRFVNETLHIPCLQIGFEDYKDRRFDILTMWYVIEHFKSLSRILRRVNHLLPIGGIFAFSTPNRNGISGRQSLETFLEESPEDHCTVWSPRVARLLMNRYGFAVRRIRITGHHPERFPHLKNIRAGGMGWRLFDRISRILCLGDTFEVYAVKERDSDE
jgi:SAM-dependent methyltransferase